MLGSVALVSLDVLQPASATLRHLAPSASEVLRQLSVSEELQAMLDSTPRPPDQLELLTKNHSPGMWARGKKLPSCKILSRISILYCCCCCCCCHLTHSFSVWLSLSLSVAEPECDAIKCVPECVCRRWVVCA